MLHLFCCVWVIQCSLGPPPPCIATNRVSVAMSLLGAVVGCNINSLTILCYWYRHWTKPKLLNSRNCGKLHQEEITVWLLESSLVTKEGIVSLSWYLLHDGYHIYVFNVDVLLTYCFNTHCQSRKFSLLLSFSLLWICPWLGSMSSWCPYAHSPDDDLFHLGSPVHLPHCPTFLLAVCLCHHGCLSPLAHTPTETQEVRVAQDEDHIYFWCIFLRLMANGLALATQICKC